ncbi:MAG: polyphenol oxidase family protein [Actinomycetota bacterium]|nr:polyphenol oxidase family protein [Actinomycetota bacterium]
MSQGGIALRVPLSLSSAHVACTGRAEGDMGHGGKYVVIVDPEVAARRRAVVDLPWTWLRQVHGDRVVRVDSPGAGSATRADAAVTSQPGVALAVFGADCAPVALASPEGIIGVAHAGWRGVTAGVIEATVAAMHAMGASEVEAVVGPCIHPGCYEFGTDDLDAVAARLGDGVRATTADGRPALDLPAACRAALTNAGVHDDKVHDVGVCTSCSPDHFSWRARSDQQRQAMVVWL